MLLARANTMLVATIRNSDANVSVHLSIKMLPFPVKRPSLRNAKGVEYFDETAINEKNS